MKSVSKKARAFGLYAEITDCQQIDANFAELSDKIAEMDRVFRNLDHDTEMRFSEVIRRLAALEAAKPGDDKVEREDLFRDLTRLLNIHSVEQGSNTPDFILARYMMGCLETYNTAIQQRSKWYGKDEGFNVSQSAILDDHSVDADKKVGGAEADTKADTVSGYTQADLDAAVEAALNKERGRVQELMNETVNAVVSATKQNAVAWVREYFWHSPHFNRIDTKTAFEKTVDHILAGDTAPGQGGKE